MYSFGCFAIAIVKRMSSGTWNTTQFNWINSAIRPYLGFYCGQWLK